MLQYVVRQDPHTDVVELLKFPRSSIGPERTRRTQPSAPPHGRELDIYVCHLPSLSELPGFHGYYLIEAGDGVMSSIGFFDTPEHADESTRLASTWVREEKLETALPNPPKVTSGKVVVHKTRELVQA
jgi:hypothetical protein